MRLPDNFVFKSLLSFQLNCYLYSLNDKIDEN